jgi:hypothetical protein
MAREGGLRGVKGEERGKEEPPDPEPFDGAPPATEAADKRMPLYVGADDHLANEYAPLSPGCHRTYRLLAAGNGG